MSQLLDRGPAVTGAHSDLAERARALQPLLATNAAEGDKTRQTNPASIEAIRESGVFDVWVPRRHGGAQADMRTQMEILAALAEGDAAAAWIGSLHTGCTFSTSLFPDEAQDEVWANGTAIGLCGGLTPAGTANKVDGGYRLSGSWMWMSGSQFASWALLSAPVVVDGEVTTVIYALAPTSELTLKDTWYTLGMRGTGSNTFVADDLFVPEYRTLPMLDETGAMNPASRSTALTGERLYTVPIGTLCATWMVGVPLGVARAALTEALRQLPKRSLSYTTYTVQKESVSTQLAVAQASTMIDQAYLLACRACADADRVVHDGDTLDIVTRARARQDTGRATAMLREAVDLLVRTCGASAMADFNPLQRHFRDMSTMSLHALNNADMQAENYGRALLGLEPSITVC